MNETDTSDLFSEYSKDDYHLLNSHLYHYTSFESAVAILNSKLFHMTNFKQLNDPIEIQYGINLLRELIEVREDDIIKKRDERFYNYLFHKIDQMYDMLKLYVKIPSRVRHVSCQG